MLMNQSKTPITSGESGTLYTGNGTYADMQKALRRHKEKAKENGCAVKHIAVYSKRRSAWWMFICTVPAQERRYNAVDFASKLAKDIETAITAITGTEKLSAPAIDIKKAIHEQLQLLIDCKNSDDLNLLERKISTLIEVYSALGSDGIDSARVGEPKNGTKGKILKSIFAQFDPEAKACHTRIANTNFSTDEIADVEVRYQ